MRKIIHIDMDCFYAAVEQRDNPEWRGKPVIVGGPPDSRGVVATASYEARKFGVKSAMPCKTAARLCPQGIFTFPRFDAYAAVSKEIRAIFKRYTDLIEPLSLDEAYLDVTENKLGIVSAIQIAQEIKAAIKSELHLTASAGVSVNKFVAKVASDMQKPDGLTFIAPDKIESFIEGLPIEKFFGVGKVTAEKMHGMGIKTGADLKQLSREDIQHYFGKTGLFYYQIVRGIDNRPVEPNREHKSVGAEDTFTNDTSDLAELLAEFKDLAGHVMQRMNKYALKGRTITIKVKYADFKQITRSKSLTQFVKDEEELYKIAEELFMPTYSTESKIRLVGISLSTFTDTVTPNIRLSSQLKLDL